MSIRLTSDQIERYSRQIMVPDLGGKGQVRLRQAKVLVIGAGGLGSPAAFYLAAAGIGTLGIVDSDKVELSNLQRQILHSTAAIGQRKVDSATAALTQINPDVDVKTYPDRLLVYDAKTMRFRDVDVKRDPSCVSCGAGKTAAARETANA